MGFNEVYKVLQEIFPQIDSRVLRAVAIEHSKDADAAIDAVLEEIIPFFTERSRQSCQSSGSMNVGESSKALIGAIPTAGIGGLQQSFHDANDEHHEPFQDINSGNQEGAGRIPGLKLSEKCEKSSAGISADAFHHVERVTVIDKSGANYKQTKISADLEREEMISAGNCPESSIETVSNHSPSQTRRTLDGMDVVVNQNMNLVPDLEEFDGSLGSDSIVAIHKENSEQLVVVPDVQESNVKKLDICLSTDATPKKEATDEMVGIEDGSILNASVSRSGQICVIDLLEDVIADSRNNKKTLFSAMESVISMMKEVELKEKNAEQAKMEAAKGSADILDRIEELRQMVQRAKEANDEHAGEVYGEKAILSTELKELRSRVLSLSDERDKSLAILHEIHKTLEMRLAAAEDVIKSVQQEKVEKENSARKALSNQELLMETVVQESKILKQQAEQNAKLREFLVDRGRVVDILQGEIAVIRQDVRMLKEKFDDHVLFSKFLSSSQTSSILASSSSSFETLVPDQVEPVPAQVDSLENPGKSDPEHCFDEQISENKATRDNRKEHIVIDEGWEIFDNHDIDM
ncbi:uncharacterized protein LOC111388525 isoform X2 [Olea europaea var. sylvestris]|uniref:uncharacterized protein LOC111388525 isoform X2 n=1 Tax=Olea europaea var. sylvestris TaxID=158386 RepID=UPI000C1D3C17|nr:uncharacterized protein LOC111388525 isoform X2 [Olea europaea var. sylvestris]